MCPDSPFITKQDFDRVAELDKYYSKNRWLYYNEAIQMLKSVGIGPGSKSIEVGPYRLPIMKDADTLDVAKGISPTYLHNAKVSPWPVTIKYDVLIALQVWEHLEGKQVEAFLEVMRVSKMALMSFPYNWDEKCIGPGHRNIDMSVISHWTLGIPPRTVKVIGKGRSRILMMFDFSNEHECYMARRRAGRW